MCEDVFFKTGVLKKFAKITGKQLRRSLFLIKPQAHSKFFTEDWSSKKIFGPVKKSSENVHISLKTKSKHEVT